MNAKHLIAAVTVFAAAGSAFADVTGNFEDYTNIPSTRTRAEVKAEMSQARAQGQLATTEYVDYSKVATTKTRSEVAAESRSAQAQGQLTNTEWVEPTAFVTTTHRTREEVRAEAIQNAKSKF